jgi:hypothetical protein
MAGTEEQDQATTEPLVDSDSDVGDDHNDWRIGREPVDDQVKTLVLSELNSRVHTARTWRAQGMVTGEPLDLVRDACREWLEATEEESVLLSGNPYVPPKPPCDKCGGVDTHKTTCAYLVR